MINIPFNFQPTSISVKTSSYTIPSGSFAYVFAQSVDGGVVTVDGANVITSRAQTFPDVIGVQNAFSLGSFASSNLYTVGTDYAFDGYLYLTTSSNFTVSVGGVGIFSTTSSISTGITPLPIKAADGDVISISTTGSGSADGTLYGTSTRMQRTGEIKECNFWAPSGTVINGTSTWQATVMLFNELT